MDTLQNNIEEIVTKSIDTSNTNVEIVQKILSDITDYLPEWQFLINELKVPFEDVVSLYSDYNETVQLMRNFNYFENHNNQVSTKLTVLEIEQQRLITTTKNISYLLKLYSYERNKLFSKKRNEYWKLITSNIEEIDRILKQIKIENEKLDN